MNFKAATVLVLTLIIGAVSFAAKGDKADRKARRRERHQPASAPATAPATQAAAPATFNKFCAVEQDNPVDPKVATYIYKDKIIGFCCSDCLEPFKKDPEKYMKTMK